MKATELRIGNWVNNGNIDYIVDYNNLIDLLDYEKVNGRMLSKPILLTKVWLVKFGFEDFMDGKNLYCKPYFNISFIGNELRYIGISGFYRNIKHVHQLQNLYFALTDNELTIK